MATEIWTYRDRTIAELDLVGFDVETSDGVVGRVDEATNDIEGSYLVVNPGSAMPLGRRVVVPAGTVDTVDLDDRRLRLNVSRDDVLGAPEFDAAHPFGAPERDRVGRHYGRTGEGRKTSRSSRSGSRRTAASRTAAPRSSDDPTKEQLYEQAKRLGIEGRSKMNKAALKRAVERRK